MRGTTGRRGLLLGLILAVLSVTAFPGSAQTRLPAADLAQAGSLMRALGWSYGSTVDAEDVRRLAGRFGLNVGSVVDAADLTRVLEVASQGDYAPPAPPSTPVPDSELAGYLDALGIGYGSVVDPADVRGLADRLGIGVGSVVDPADVDRVTAVARDLFEGSYPLYGTVGGILLRAPSDRVELVGFHQSNHEGARQVTPIESRLRSMTLPSRGRYAGTRSAADIVTPVGVELRSPVTGTVKRAGTYVLYCRYSDDYAVIEPDAHPGWEVKLLHIDGVSVRAGDRVVAGETVVARGPTPLPFSSQIDRYTASGRGPHVHIEVIDPSIPNVASPNSGC